MTFQTQTAEWHSFLNADSGDWHFACYITICILMLVRENWTELVGGQRVSVGNILRRKAVDLEKEFEPIFTSEHPSTKPDPWQPCSPAHSPDLPPLCFNYPWIIHKSNFQKPSDHLTGVATSHHVTAPNRLRRYVWLSVFPGYHTRQSIFLHNNCYSFQVNISRNLCFSCHLVLPHFWC